ncbi:hypothetical protein RDI58_007342 [Solanum bulbocastanum]|uniref:Uncharacterized protein n=1 Tax=Solanum bulbocastanum TaxID=147425 RepID=A0AAN8TUR0_SOLBU
MATSNKRIRKSSLGSGGWRYQIRLKPSSGYSLDYPPDNTSTTFGINVDHICKFSRNGVENIYHVFIQCQRATTFWRNMAKETSLSLSSIQQWSMLKTGKAPRRPSRTRNSTTGSHGIDHIIAQATEFNLIVAKSNRTKTTRMVVQVEWIFPSQGT